MEPDSLLSEVSTIEILIIIMMAFIGSSVHEYMNFVKGKTAITIDKWLTIIIVTIVDSIISFAVNPFIISVHPRLIFLHPLLIGLLGIGLINKLTTINGSCTLIEYVLSWFHITKAKDVDTPCDACDPIQQESKDTKDNDNDTEQEENIESCIANFSIFTSMEETTRQKYVDNITSQITHIDARIEETILEYSLTGNAASFFKRYARISKLYLILKLELDNIKEEYGDIPKEIYHKLDRLEVLKEKTIEIYNSIN